MAQEDVFKKLVAHCKEYGYVFPSSEIYDGLAAVYDYGQYGVELKNNIKRYWWDSMVLLHENVVGLDSAIFMHPTIWKASGHVDAFNDPLIDNKDSKKRYRADVLIEDHIAKYEEKIEKEVAKARKRFGEKFDEALFRQTNPQVQVHRQKKEELTARMAKALNDNDLAELRQIIVDNKRKRSVLFEGGGNGGNPAVEGLGVQSLFNDGAGLGPDGRSRRHGRGQRKQTRLAFLQNGNMIARRTARQVGSCRVARMGSVRFGVRPDSART